MLDILLDLVKNDCKGERHLLASFCAYSVATHYIPNLKHWCLYFDSVFAFHHSQNLFFCCVRDFFFERIFGLNAKSFLIGNLSKKLTSSLLVLVEKFPFGLEERISCLRVKPLL